jgi:hypothetical protein
MEASFEIFINILFVEIESSNVNIICQRLNYGGVKS